MWKVTGKHYPENAEEHGKFCLCLQFWFFLHRRFLVSSLLKPKLRHGGHAGKWNSRSSVVKWIKSSIIYGNVKPKGQLRALGQFAGKETTCFRNVSSVLLVHHSFPSYEPFGWVRMTAGTGYIKVFWVSWMFPKSLYYFLGKAPGPGMRQVLHRRIFGLLYLRFPIQVLVFMSFEPAGSLQNIGLLGTHNRIIHQFWHRMLSQRGASCEQVNFT